MEADVPLGDDALNQGVFEQGCFVFVVFGAIRGVADPSLRIRWLLSWIDSLRALSMGRERIGAESRLANSANIATFSAFVLVQLRIALSLNTGPKPFQQNGDRFQISVARKGGRLCERRSLWIGVSSVSPGVGR